MKFLLLLKFAEIISERVLTGSARSAVGKSRDHDGKLRKRWVSFSFEKLLSLQKPKSRYTDLGQHCAVPRR
jgi:hypothetical protein